MTESGVDDRTGGRVRSQPSVLGFDFDGAWRAGGAQQEARDVVAEADHALLDLLARAGKGWLPSRLRERATWRRRPRCFRRGRSFVRRAPVWPRAFFRLLVLDR